MSVLTPLRRPSITEIWRTQTLAVPHGTIVEVHDFPAFAYAYATVTARASDFSPFNIRIQWLQDTAPAGFPTFAATTAPSFVPSDVESDGLRSQTGWLEARTNRFKAYIENTDSVDRTYDVLICGVR
jgi:hypothetical protein